jgi:low affinity Fe/Cu permease
MTAQPERKTWRDHFNRLTDRATTALGSAAAVGLSVLVVLIWAVLGPVFNFSDSWQLVINTATTVVTFWMVFVIQASQNRDARALHLKLDEIIRATEPARNEFIVAEKATEAELEARETELRGIAGGGSPGVSQSADQRGGESSG